MREKHGKEAPGCFLRKRCRCRLYRNPLVLFGPGPLFHFLFLHRFPTWQTGRPEHRSVVITNLAIAALALIAIWTIGWKTYLLIQIPVLWLAGIGGIWLFFVQHQFEGVYWSRGDQIPRLIPDQAVETKARRRKGSPDLDPSHRHHPPGPKITCWPAARFACMVRLAWGHSVYQPVMHEEGAL